MNDTLRTLRVKYEALARCFTDEQHAYRDPGYLHVRSVLDAIDAAAMMLSIIERSEDAKVELVFQGHRC